MAKIKSEKIIDEKKQGAVYSQGAKNTKNAYIETYGCQMNFSDTEIVASMLSAEGYGFVKEKYNADLILLNTCSVRDNAEQKVWNKLEHYKQLKKQNPNVKIGIIGCMAERLKNKILENTDYVDIVLGPDAYKSLPDVLDKVAEGERAINVKLSRTETYEDIFPLKLSDNKVSAYISIMRGCNNMCSFCVVPFTRGRERSRSLKSILEEVEKLVEAGYKEVYLLGQNVDSYKYEDITFAKLLEETAKIAPSVRVRFTTSHPKDMTDDVLETMAKYDNICKYIHLPIQAGNNRILELMRRGYTKEWYLERIKRIREIIPDCALSTDIIVGFPTETEAEFRETLEVMEEVHYDSAYMFYYSERPGTYAARKFIDDIPMEVKKRRLQEVIRLQNQLSLESNKRDIGKVFEVLIERDARRDKNYYFGRNSQNKKIIFPKTEELKYGDYVNVKINKVTSATLIGEIER